MIIEIQNFGPIKKFTYDLEKDIIITYGNNNIGKSIAMQMVYLLLKTFIKSNAMVVGGYLEANYLRMNMVDEVVESSQIIKSFIESEDEVKEITGHVEERVMKILSATYLQEFFVSCGNTFGNFDKTMNKNAAIQIDNDDLHWKIDLYHKCLDGSFNIQPILLKKVDLEPHNSGNSEQHFNIYVTEDISIPNNIIAKQVVENVVRCIESIRNNIVNVYFLPASRSGIYSGMNAFGSIVAELSKSRAFFTKKIEFPGISEPISDYFISLSNINKGSENEILSPCYKEIEKTILKGQVTFDKNKSALLYRPDNVDTTFEMTEVSSMVSEIAPIVAFMKYILSFQATKNEFAKVILFIEEPEAHLHPNNQIKLMEIFSELSSYNVQLIMSSHSNYIFNKMNNLVLGKKVDYNIYEPILLEDKDGGSISKMLELDELGASDENFVDVSEKLYAEREEIIRKLNMEE